MSRSVNKQKRIKCNKFTLELAVKLYCYNKIGKGKEPRLPLNDFRRSVKKKELASINLIEKMPIELSHLCKNWSILQPFSKLKNRLVYEHNRH
jgi:hypothetical protein